MEGTLILQNFKGKCRLQPRQSTGGEHFNDEQMSKGEKDEMIFEDKLDDDEVGLVLLCKPLFIRRKLFKMDRHGVME